MMKHGNGMLQKTKTITKSLNTIIDDNEKGYP